MQFAFVKTSFDFGRYQPFSGISVPAKATLGSVRQTYRELQCSINDSTSANQVLALAVYRRKHVVLPRF